MAGGKSANRIAALDFTKGALVLIMVLYHWLNYFYGGHDNRYLRFLTPSFICITGFLISNIYISKYGLSDSQLPKRLLQRGLKLFGVFFLLNIARSLLVAGGFSGYTDSFAQNLIDVYILGNGIGGGQSKVVAFSILIPISYLLILSALLVIIARYYRYIFHVACLLLFVAIIVFNFQGIESPNLNLLAIGILGVIVGYVPIAKVNSAVRHTYLLVAAYMLYLVAISFWDVIYPLQIIGVFLSLMIIYWLGQQSVGPKKLRECVILLGNYSLAGYIAQIMILQLLRAGFNRFGAATIGALLALSFVLAIALTIASIEVVDRTRAESRTIDRLYRAVFA